MLVDTNVISELMRARPTPGVVEWAERQDGMNLSVITLEEIFVATVMASRKEHGE